MLTTDEMEREAYQAGNYELAGLLEQLADAEETDTERDKEITELEEKLQKAEDALSEVENDRVTMQSAVADLVAEVFKGMTKADLIDRLQQINELVQV